VGVRLLARTPEAAAKTVEITIARSFSSLRSSLSRDSEERVAARRHFEGRGAVLDGQFDVVRACDQGRILRLGALEAASAALPDGFKATTILDFPAERRKTKGYFLFSA
jgi:hypothetical protein